jgi:hypothetical protein
MMAITISPILMPISSSTIGTIPTSVSTSTCMSSSMSTNNNPNPNPSTRTSWKVTKIIRHGEQRQMF